MDDRQPASAHPLDRVRLLAGLLAVGMGAVLVAAGLFTYPRQGQVTGTASAGPSGAGAAGSPVPSLSPSAGSAASPPASGGPSASASPSAALQLLLAVGDIARCDAPGDEATARLAASLTGAIALLGDTVYPRGTAAELRDCFEPSWGAVRDRIRWAATGNHDDLTDAGAPLRAYLGEAAARDGRTWFSDTLGVWHVIVLDSNCDVVEGGCGADSPQGRWLAADLEANATSPTARCTVALFHHPRFSSGEHGDDTAVAPLWDLLWRGGADLVVNGHDHDYERFDPQAPDGSADAATGIVELVVGTGGGELRAFTRGAPNSVARIPDVYGLVALQLGADGWRSRFIATDGTLLDDAGGTCH